MRFITFLWPSVLLFSMMAHALPVGGEAPPPYHEVVSTINLRKPAAAITVFTPPQWTSLWLSWLRGVTEITYTLLPPPHMFHPTFKPYCMRMALRNPLTSTGPMTLRKAYSNDCMSPLPPSNLRLLRGSYLPRLIGSSRSRLRTCSWSTMASFLRLGLLMVRITITGHTGMWSQWGPQKGVVVYWRTLHMLLPSYLLRAKSCFPLGVSMDAWSWWLISSSIMIVAHRYQRNLRLCSSLGLLVVRRASLMSSCRVRFWRLR
ncbi:hypothetical protein C8R42DRAFT_776373 [Lentinula raphanica]|nr:hypothetical protein C8R42DRAFT_776373 [Lentinula raphanica]